MVRVADWPRKLSEYIDEMRKAPFQWGENDCLTFAAKGVERLTGENFYNQYPGYDEDTAEEILKEHGGVKGIIERHLGKGQPNVLMAKRGDVVTVRVPELTAGLVDDSGQFVAVVTPEGLRRIPLSKANRYWSY